MAQQLEMIATLQQLLTAQVATPAAAAIVAPTVMNCPFCTKSISIFLFF